MILGNKTTMPSVIYFNSNINFILFPPLVCHRNLLRAAMGGFDPVSY